LPFILDREPKPVSKDIDVRIPAHDVPQSGANPAPEPPAVTAPAPVVPAPRFQEDSPKSPPDAAKATEKTVTTKPDLEPKPVAPAAKPQAKSQKPASINEKSPVKPSGDGQYVVQLGAFSNPANARKVQEKASAEGYNAYSEQLKSQAGNRTRVRAGPFVSREEAESARVKLKAAGIDGVVTTR
jgi:DedD protein